MPSTPSAISPREATRRRRERAIRSLASAMSRLARSRAHSLACSWTSSGTPPVSSKIRLEVLGRPGFGGVQLADAPNGIARQRAEGELRRCHRAVPPVAFGAAASPRKAPTTSMGAARHQPARSATTSRVSASATCRSSSTISTGRPCDQVGRWRATASAMSPESPAPPSTCPRDEPALWRAWPSRARAPLWAWSQRPYSTAAPSSWTSRASSATSRVLPIPSGPSTDTKPPRPSTASAHACRSHIKFCFAAQECGTHGGERSGKPAGCGSRQRGEARLGTGPARGRPPRVGADRDRARCRARRSASGGPAGRPPRRRADGPSDTRPR